MHGFVCPDIVAAVAAVAVVCAGFESFAQMRIVRLCALGVLSCWATGTRHGVAATAAEYAIIVLKSANHFLKAFQGISGEILYTGACGYNRSCAHQICRKISAMHGLQWPITSARIVQMTMATAMPPATHRT